MLTTICIVTCAIGESGIKFLEHKPEMLLLKGINCYLTYSNWILGNLISRGSGKVCIHLTLLKAHLVGFHWVSYVVVLNISSSDFAIYDLNIAVAA